MRYFAKVFAATLAWLIVFPFAAVYWVSRLLFEGTMTFAGWSQALSLLPGLTGVYLRRAFYQLVLPQCDDAAFISFGTVMSHPTCRIGKSVYVGCFCVLGDITLDDEVLIGSHVSIMNGNRQHGIERLDIPIREQPGRWPRITIGRDTWIGDRAVIMADVGKHCVVGAGSVVTKPVPDYAIVAGAPARILSDRRERLNHVTLGVQARAEQLASVQRQPVAG